MRHGERTVQTVKCYLLRHRLDGTAKEQRQNICIGIGDLNKEESGGNENLGRNVWNRDFGAHMRRSSQLKKSFFPSPIHTSEDLLTLQCAC